ncbi:MAG: hypothetical protein R3C46_15205 [Hyphomonadaceae bacterium]
MDTRISGLAGAIAVVLSGCASDSRAPAPVAPEPANSLAERVDRMRGCWIAREGAGAVFLRLLAPSVGAPVIEGGVDHAGASTVEREATLSFARDGSFATFTHGDNPAERFVAATADWMAPDAGWLAYRSNGAEPLFLLVEAPGDTLRIMTTAGPGGGPMSMSPVYEGNRDGCD